MSNEDILKRFELRDGQFFGRYLYKNQQWYLNGTYVGFGDLRDDDVLRIATELDDGEEFVGWNEHHGTQWQQTDTPFIRITNQNIILRDEIVEREGHRLNR
jgi:hypothetical protein